MQASGRKKIFDLILGFALFYIISITFLYFVQRSLIYFPNPSVQNPVHYNASDMDVVKAMTDDGLELSAWYKAPQDGKPIIIVFHGNASHMGMSAWKVRGFMDEGYGALLPAYRGYAGNPGKPTEQGLYKDARAWLDWLVNEKQYSQNRIVILGESLGSGVAVEMAAGPYKDIKAVILESPYTSFVDMAKRNYFFVPFVGHLVRDKYKSIDKIKDVKAPLLIVHGQRDIVVPYKLGDRLYDAANEPKAMVDLPMAGHNDLYMHGAGPRIMDFLSGL